MNRDPNYHLQRANFYYQRALENGYDPRLDEYSYTDIDDNDTEDDNDIDSEEYEYEYVPIQIVNQETTPVFNKKNENTNIKPAYKRYYDPITKHYYKTEKVLTNKEVKPIPKAVEKNAQVWYPENKLSFKTMRDPDTGKFYRVNKIYDDNGQYSYKYDKLQNEMRKLPGTNYYKPVYRTVKK
ncbi:hypothetical protein QJ856_gp1220 [Tupanvirus deep ocean]|uniref:Uncharacterized protein n=2 Tax=Tupanvirus TaxID=2094720 RepID=A0AC62A6Y4_9VIRU|nr:hypothetical protein QJ856_gp1220 [Tupanvirus deep ocean]QKU33544.1 hypothetical protein [Tupanvirus deep ocean]